MASTTLKCDPVAAVTIYLSRAAGVFFWAIVLWAILS